MSDTDDRDLYVLTLEARGRAAIFLLFLVGMVVGGAVYALAGWATGLL